jgi:hypothetical protein
VLAHRRGGDRGAPPGVAGVHIGAVAEESLDRVEPTGARGLDQLAGRRPARRFGPAAGGEQDGDQEKGEEEGQGCGVGW